MDEILEGLIKLFSGFFRYIGYQIIVSIILFNIGRISLLIVTFGKYPSKNEADKDKDFIAMWGFSFLLIIWALIVLFNNNF